MNSTKKGGRMALPVIHNLMKQSAHFEDYEMQSGSW